MKGLYRSPAVVIILSIVTCGIYGLYWIYTMSTELNAYLGKTNESPGPGLETLLVLVTCGIYGYYWSYKYAKRVGEAKAKAGLAFEDNSILCLILAIFGLFVVNMALIQDSANQVWEANN